eukprot:2204211-Rhodomonas_salina.1
MRERGLWNSVRLSQIPPDILVRAPLAASLLASCWRQRKKKRCFDFCVARATGASEEGRRAQRGLRGGGGGSERGGARARARARARSAARAGLSPRAPLRPPLRYLPPTVSAYAPPTQCPVLTYCRPMTYPVPPVSAYAPPTPCPVLTHHVQGADSLTPASSTPRPSCYPPPRSLKS